MPLRHRGGQAHQSAQFGMGKDDAPMRPAQHRGWWLLPGASPEEAGLRRHERMAPPVEDDAGNVAPRIEARRAEHLGHLLANLSLEIGVAGRKEARSRRRALGRGGQARVEERDVKGQHGRIVGRQQSLAAQRDIAPYGHLPSQSLEPPRRRSEEHTSELQSLMRISYAVFCLQKKNTSNSTANTQDSNHNI